MQLMWRNLNTQILRVLEPKTHVFFFFLTWALQEALACRALAVRQATTGHSEVTGDSQITPIFHFRWHHTAS